jgi:ATP-dependent DNA helicase RecG
MSLNGSSAPVFETDDSSYVLVTFHNRMSQASNQVSNQVNSLIFNTLHDFQFFISAESNQVNNQVSNQVIEMIKSELGEHALDILTLLSTEEKTSRTILSHVGISKQTKNTRRLLIPLMTIGWVMHTIPDNPTHPNQKYRLTAMGLKVIHSITMKRELIPVTHLSPSGCSTICAPRSLLRIN